MGHTRLEVNVLFSQDKGKQEPNGKGVHIAPADSVSVRRRCILDDNCVPET